VRISPKSLPTALARTLTRTLVFPVVLAAIAFAPAARAQESADEAIEIQGGVVAAEVPGGTAEDTAAETTEEPTEEPRQPADPAVEAAVEGFWRGVLTLPGGSDFRIIFRVWREDDGTLSSLMDSPDQGAADLPVDRIVIEGRTVRLELTFAGAFFEGEMAADETEIEGLWHQAAMEMPLTLMRLEEFPEVRRAQEPVEPFPYAVEEVTYVNEEDDVTLAGTLTVPESIGPVPAAILISGSGAQDRDESLFGHRPFLVLADYLTRVDVRGSLA